MRRRNNLSRRNFYPNYHFSVFCLRGPVLQGTLQQSCCVGGRARPSRCMYRVVFNDAEQTALPTMKNQRG
eukprot:4972580-Amphidinium_carterae.1